MKTCLKPYAILFIATLLSACGEEEYVFPDLITEMVCLKTDANGYGDRIVTDNGNTWHFRKGNQPDSLTTDSTYRVVCRFAPLTTADASHPEATAYSLRSVIAPIPKPASEYQTITTDPVDIQSIWTSGNYLNMVLKIKIKDQEHELSFIEDEISVNADGTKTFSFTLFHDRKNDIEGFDEKYYLSIPLWHYEGKINKGDTILLKLNTFKEGMTTRSFIY